MVLSFLRQRAVLLLCNCLRGYHQMCTPPILYWHSTVSLPMSGNMRDPSPHDLAVLASYPSLYSWVLSAFSSTLIARVSQRTVQYRLLVSLSYILPLCATHWVAVHDQLAVHDGLSPPNSLPCICGSLSTMCRQPHRSHSPLHNCWRVPNTGGVVALWVLLPHQQCQRFSTCAVPTVLFELLEMLRQYIASCFEGLRLLSIKAKMS